MPPIHAKNTQLDKQNKNAHTSPHGGDAMTSSQATSAAAFKEKMAQKSVPDGTSSQENDLKNTKTTVATTINKMVPDRAGALLERLTQKKSSGDKDAHEFEFAPSTTPSRNDKEKVQHERDILPPDASVPSSLFSLRDRLNPTNTSSQNTKVEAQNIQATAAATRQESVDLLQALSSRILVSTPRADGSKEVHIHIKNDLLPQTEARLQLNGNQLQVNLVCADMNTANFLTQNAASLQNVLAQKHVGDVTVTVTDGNATQSDRAGQDGDRGSGDGRSRQQRNIYDEMQD